MKKIIALFVGMVFAFTLALSAAPAHANTGSFTWGEYGGVDYGEKRVDVEDSGVNGCNCTGHQVADITQAGNHTKAFEYTNNVGEIVGITYLYADTGKWVAVCKGWTGPATDFVLASAGSWGKYRGNCWHGPPAGGSGGSW